MTQRPASYPVRLLELPYEELEFLWGQRQTALRSPAYSSGELARLEARIEDQVQGLLAAGEALPAFLRPRLLAPRARLAFAAAYPLLRSRQEAEGLVVLEALLRADGPSRAGIGEALCQAAPDSLLARLRERPGVTLPEIAATAQILACRQPTAVVLPKLTHRLLEAPGPDERRAGWRALALRGESLADKVFERGLREPDPAVRDEALWAAAWAGHAEVRMAYRRLAAAPTNGAALRLLAIVATPDDVDLLLDAARNSALGPRRLEALGALGHPEGVGILLEEMESSDGRTAVAAGRAFARLTGFAAWSDRLVTLPPEDGRVPDAFEREFLQEVYLPDAARARTYWDSVGGAFAGGTRWCRGLNLSEQVSEDILGQLDRESFWEARLRGKVDGSWGGRLADLERCTQEARQGNGPPALARKWD
jgi:uncharacterized protein (TIGR02270 family)